MSDNIKPGDKLAKRYKIVEKIGFGGFGRVYRAYDKKRREEVAIKVLETSGKVPLSSEDEESSKPKPCFDLKTEYWALKHVEKYIGFPKAYELGIHEEYGFIVMELLGDSILSLFKRGNRTFSLKNLLLLMDQCLVRIQNMHEAGIVHGDIKPENMTIGKGENPEIIYFIDFGLASMFWDYQKGEHVEERSYGVYGGTLQYMSTNVHHGKQKTRRDDLISLAYTFAMFLSHDNLPWKGLTDAERPKVRDKKLEMNGDSLFYGHPKEFAVFYESVMRLGFKEMPEYNMYKKLFRRLGASLGVNYNVDSLVF